MNENEVFALSRVVERERKKRRRRRRREKEYNACTRARALCLKKFACPFFAFHHQTKKKQQQFTSIFELSKKSKTSVERESRTTNNNKQHHKRRSKSNKKKKNSSKKISKTKKMKRNNGGAGFRQRSDHQLVTGKPQAPAKSAAASSSSGGVAAKLAASSSQQHHHQTTNHSSSSSSSSSSSQSNNNDDSSQKGGMKNNQSWTTKHWLGAVLVPALFFLSVVLVSNSNYGKSVEEVTALMAEKETLSAQDENANELDPEASTEEISSRVNAPTEEEQAMEEIRSARESNEMEDEQSDVPHANRASDTCAYFEQQASLQYFFKNRCDFDADAKLINPADKSEKPGRVKLEFIALASYMEGFSYIEHKRISDKKAAEALKIRAEAETAASYSEGEVDDDQRDTEEHVLEAAIAQSPPPPMGPPEEIVEEAEEEVAEGGEEEEQQQELSAEEQIAAAEEQLAYEKEKEETQMKKKWQFWKKADKKVPSSRASDSDLLAMEMMEKAEEAAEQEEQEGGESQEESEEETTINRRMLLKKKGKEGKEQNAPNQATINQAEPNAMVGPKPYKAIVIGQKQAAFGLLIARSFKTLQMPAVTEIYEGEPKAFERVVEMTEHEAKEAGAGDVRVKQEVIGNKNGMHEIELSKSKDDARKGLTNRRTMSVPMITGDSLIANTKHEEKTIVLHMGEEHVDEVIKGFQKTLNHGGRIGGPVSTPRIVFFRAKKLKEASEAFKGLPFQVFIVGKPRDETSSSGRPFLMRIDGVRYNEHLDSIKDDMTYLVMALHHNDPYIDVAFSEGATVCDAKCNCFTSSTFRQAAPVCSGHTAHLESYKDHTWTGPKNKAKIRHAHLFGSDGHGGQMRVQQNVESAVLNRLDNFLNKDLPSLETVDNRDWISEGMQQAEDEANGVGEFAPKVKGKKKKKKYEEEFTNEYLMKNPLRSSGYSWTGGNGFAGAGGSTIEKDVREVDFRKKSKQKNSKHIN